LRQAVAPTFTLSLSGVRSADVYQVDDRVLKVLKDLLVR
jgi:hypothetical protein